MPFTKTTLEDIFKPIESYLSKIESVIPEKLTSGISLMDEGTLRLFKNSGKKIRASLVIFCSGLNGKIPEDITETAAAVETFHAATLIHDDIIDQAFFRRGGKTVSKEWGNKAAVLMGDFMYIRALQTILEDGKPLIIPELLAAALDMIKGEIYQMEFSNIDSISREHYFNIIELKTAEFMGTCAKLGAMKSEMSAPERDSLYNYGLNIGRAFQIVDDTFDYSDDQKTIGKDAGNDFFNGKITLPFIYLLEDLKGKDREILMECAKNPCHDSWETIKRMIKEFNAIKHCMDAARDYVNKALPCLDGFPSSVYKEKLFLLSEFLIERNY